MAVEASGMFLVRLYSGCAINRIHGSVIERLVSAVLHYCPETAACLGVGWMIGYSSKTPMLSTDKSLGRRVIVLDLMQCTYLIVLLPNLK
jgi:hypothetical protein